ncbi:MAG TPA: preprotein translocase subunit YajC [Ornithinibacter sp.]|jgi:preprotein translocase subunit YajC|nr:preprotein translocase subunit YajC [Ornithinibacter sp.]
MFSGSGSGLGYLLILLLPFLMLVFIIVSQRRRSQQVRALQESLKVGDEVLTTSGLYGTIVALDDTVATLDVGAGTTLRYDRRAIGMRSTEVA